MWVAVLLDIFDDIHVLGPLCKPQRCLCSDLNWKKLSDIRLGSICKRSLPPSQSLRATPLAIHSTDCLSKTPKDQSAKFMTRFKATNLDACRRDTNFWSIFQDCNLEGSPRHSLGSNNSSNLSTPPSPVREMGSSSYESWIQTWKVKNTKFYVDRRSSQHIARASRSLPAGGLFGQKRVRPLSSRDSCHFRKEGGAVAVGLWGFHIQIQFNLTFPS